MQAERHRNRENPERFRVLLRAPAGIGSVQTFSRRHIDVAPDGTVEMSAEDADYLIRAGWTKLAEWTDDEAPEGEQTEARNKPQGPKPVYAKGSMEWQQEQEKQSLARIAAEQDKERRRLARITAVLGKQS